MPRPAERLGTTRADVVARYLDQCNQLVARGTYASWEPTVDYSVSTSSAYEVVVNYPHHFHISCDHCGRQLTYTIINSIRDPRLVLGTVGERTRLTYLMAADGLLNIPVICPDDGYLGDRTIVDTRLRMCERYPIVPTSTNVFTPARRRFFYNGYGILFCRTCPSNQEFWVYFPAEDDDEDEPVTWQDVLPMLPDDRQRGSPIIIFTVETDEPMMITQRSISCRCHGIFAVFEAIYRPAYYFQSMHREEVRRSSQRHGLPRTNPAA